ncbi:MAG: hypothetical protein IPO67_06235 [Deltaproteobacteria bacterium]|nr:hypothetical protein [Deltaproteobacteria bacterium]
MLTLSLVLLTFACGGRKSEPVEAPATPEGAPTLPVEGQPGPTITPTESQAAVHKALSVRDPEPECADCVCAHPRARRRPDLRGQPRRSAAVGVHPRRALLGLGPR